MKRKESNFILIGILVGLVLAGISLPIFGEKMKAVGFLGEFFLLALKMVVVPLVLGSVITGITSLGDVRKIGGIGARTLAYYAATTAMAVMLGMLLVSSIRPGDAAPADSIILSEMGMTEERAAKVQKDVSAKKDMGAKDIVLSVLHPNIFGALADGSMLPIIVFSMFFGGILTTLGEKGRPVIAFFEGLNEAMMKMVGLIMWLAPIGVFGLVAAKFAEVPPDQWKEILKGIGLYMGTVLLGLFIHGFAVLPSLLWVLARRNPLRYFAAYLPALLTAWSTASSSATLPVTIECAEERAGINPKSSRFVIPLGATINMDGTALYEAVGAITIAQMYGVPLGPMQFVLIFLTATLVSIGAAGIPQAGLFMMVIVLNAVGLPMEGITIILVVDWLLDRFRTAINVWGDCVGAAYIHRVMETGAKS